MLVPAGDHTSLAEPGQHHVLQSQMQPAQSSAVSTMASCSCLLACVQLDSRELEERFSILHAEHGAWTETEPTKEGEVQGTREGNTAPALGIASGGLSPTGCQLMSQVMLIVMSTRLVGLDMG